MEVEETPKAINGKPLKYLNQVAVADDLGLVGCKNTRTDVFFYAHGQCCKVQFDVIDVCTRKILKVLSYITNKITKAPFHFVNYTGDMRFWIHCKVLTCSVYLMCLSTQFYCILNFDL